MAFERPTLSEIIERVQADVESRTGKKAMRWSLASVLSRVIAGTAHGLYGFISFVLRQCFSSTAEGAYLERRASEYAVYRKPAAKAVGTVTFTCSGTVPSGTQLQNEEGAVYVTTADSLGGVAPIEAVAAGASGNAVEGMELSLVSPVAGVSSTAVAGVLTGGVEAEDDESLRERLLERQKNPPKAGTKADYVMWSKQVPGVTRAWCTALEQGIGSVTVRFMTDGLTSDGIPDAVMIERVRKLIEENMPVTTQLYVVAPIPKLLNITLDVMPDTPQIRAKIQSAIEAVILAEAVPGGPILLTSIDRAVSGVSDVKSYRITTPTDDVTTTTGEIYVPGTMTWV